jgi:hypothetical protein
MTTKMTISKEVQGIIYIYYIKFRLFSLSLCNAPFNKLVDIYHTQTFFSPGARSGTRNLDLEMTRREFYHCATSAVRFQDILMRFLRLSTRALVTKRHKRKQTLEMFRAESGREREGECV